MSCDHKPDRKEERERIEAAGGTVQARQLDPHPFGPYALHVYAQFGRVGCLSVSRAFGDIAYKKIDSKSIAVT